MRKPKPNELIWLKDTCDGHRFIEKYEVALNDLSNSIKNKKQMPLEAFEPVAFYLTENQKQAINESNYRTTANIFQAFGETDGVYDWYLKVFEDRLFCFLNSINTAASLWLYMKSNGLRSPSCYINNK
jgi:hypothetical protein